MAWKMIEKPQTRLASRSLAKEFSEMEPAPYDRPLSERRLMVYQRILKAGDFRPVTWASAVCLETNCTYRVNGKHTSVMISQMDPLPEFYVTTERYQCDSLQDVANLYNTFDSNLASRSATDINLAFAATIRELKGVPARIINNTVTAAAFLKWGDAAAKIPQAERAEELMDVFPFIQWLHGLMPAGHSGNRDGINSYKHLCRSPIITAMLATHNRAPQKSADFWLQVRDETATQRDDPTRVIARWLVRVTLSGGRQRVGRQGAEAYQAMVTAREMYVKCLHAWNAWRKNETTTLKYYPKADLPKVS